jgi:RHS repeat-associated protein
MKDRIEEYTKHYYTGNHLSSTQLVTDGTGVAVQQVEYAPFGEVVNEYNIDWSNGQVPDFKFNGKELDEENGMYYFEARYQSPPVFISRDVMFEKYPTLSPYSYCANNPVKYVDMTGEELKNGYQEYREQWQMAYNFLRKEKDNFQGSKKELRALNRRLQYAKSQFEKYDYLYNEVNRAMEDLSKYNNELYQSLDALDDENGNRVDVYAQINYSLHENKLRGNVAFDKNLNLVGYEGRKNTVLILLAPNTPEYTNDLGQSLAHEGGHVNYIIKNKSIYTQWLKDKGIVSEDNVINTQRFAGGHSKGDPSGAAADFQETKYMKNKYNEKW